MYSNAPSSVSIYLNKFVDADRSLNRIAEALVEFKEDFLFLGCVCVIIIIIIIISGGGARGVKGVTGCALADCD